MRFGKCKGPLGVIGGHLYEVWGVYGHPRPGGHKGSFIMRFGKCTGTLGGHRWSFT